MPNAKLKSGDLVTYRDRDEILWGPWEVLDISGNIVTVAVEERVNCTLDASLIERVECSKQLVP